MGDSLFSRDFLIFFNIECKKLIQKFVKITQTFFKNEFKCALLKVILTILLFRDTIKYYKLYFLQGDIYGLSTSCRIAFPERNQNA